MDKPCLLPFIHIETTPSGGARPCCMWTGADVGNFHTQSLEAIWHGEPLETLRAQFRKGEQPAGCANCWKSERAGYTSKRINDNERFAHHTHGVTLDSPVYLDLKLGSICNIKCRICSTEYSQKWRDDETLIYGKPRYPTHINWLEEGSQFWQDLEHIAPTIEFIDFTGGEPFLVRGHWRLLEYLVKHGHSPNISIHYNTNGTILPTTDQRKLWSSFKWVETMFSFDGLGSRFEYQRHPAQWSVAERNFTTILEEGVTHTTLCYTVNVFNVMYMQEFLDWAPRQPYWNLLHGPDHYSIKNLPQHIKQHIADSIPDDAIREYMLNTEQDPGAWQRFLRLTQQLDTIRNESFSTVFPELDQLINTQR